MTHAKDFVGAIVFLSIFTTVNGFLTLEDAQNGYHSEKQAYVGQYFKATIDFGQELACTVSRLQVSEAYSHEQPSWLALNATARFLHGIPQENEIGSVILLVTGFSENPEGQDFICRQLAWKVTVELDPKSLVLALSQYIGNSTDDQIETDSLQRCFTHPSVIIATLRVGVKISSQIRPLGKLVDFITHSLNTSTELIQVVESSSPITYHKQLGNLNILRHGNFLKASKDSRSYHISWPLGCDHSKIGLFDIHNIHRRSLSNANDVEINSWHLTSGHFNGEVLARKRRAVFFGSITALEGTPLETSVLPTKFLSSVVATSLSQINATISFRSTSVVQTSSLSPSSVLTQTRPSSALFSLPSYLSSSIPTKELSSFVTSSYYQEASSIASSLLRSKAGLTSIFMTSSTLPSLQSQSSSLSNLQSLSLAPHSSQTYHLPSISSSSVVQKSTYGTLLSSYPSAVSKSSFNVALSSVPYFSSSLPLHSPLTVESTCSSGNCASTPTSSVPLGSSNSRFAPSASHISSLLYISSIVSQRTNISYSSPASLLPSRTSTAGIKITAVQASSVVVSSVVTPLYPSITPSSIAPTRHTSASSSPTPSSLTPLTSVKMAASLYSTVSFPSPSYTMTSLHSTPYRHTASEVSSVVSEVPSSIATSYATSIRGTSNVSLQTITLQSASMLPSASTVYATSSSLHSSSPLLRKTLSSSVPYQPSSTMILGSISIILSSKTGPLTSSRESAMNMTSATKTTLLTLLLPSKSAIAVESVSRRTEISLTSVPQVTTPGISVTKVGSSLTFELKSLASMYSAIPSYTSKQAKDASRGVSSIGRIFTPSSLISSSFMSKVSTLPSSESHNSSFMATNTSLFYVSTSVKPTLSSFISPTDTSLSPGIVKSASKLSPSSNVLSSAKAVSTLGRISTSLVVPHKSRVSTASLVADSSSGLSRISSGLSAKLKTTIQSTPMHTVTIFESTRQQGVSTIVTASSRLNTYQRLSLTTRFTSIILPSSSINASSVTSTVVTSQRPNTSPTLVNSIGRVTAHVGRLLTYKIPPDTFYDQENGFTPNLTVTCRYANGQPLEKSFWIVYDNVTQTFTGLPLVNEYNRQGSDGARLEVIARDQFGGTARDVFNVYIQNIVVDIQFALSARISRQFPEFQADSSLKVTLFNRIIRFYNTSSMSSYYASSLTNGSVLFAWSDTTIAGATCNRSAITTIASNIQAPSGSVTSKFAQAMLPDFPVLGVTLGYYGVCLATPTTPAVPVGPAAGQGTGGIFAQFVVPAIAVALVLALVIGALIFLSKRRRGKPSFLEKKTFRKGRPVLLPEEYELDGVIKSPVVSLPEDYVFSSTEDGRSIYSQRLSDNGGDDDDETYMDNPLYGLSKFKKPPPMYTREAEIDEDDSDYESPYARPPPSYQFPPFYKDEELMTSEV